MRLYRTVITAEWSHVTGVQGLCWSSRLFIAQWSPRNDHTWLASRACVLILVPLPHRTEITAEWSHVTVQCLCWSSRLFIAQWSPRSDHTWLASSAVLIFMRLYRTVTSAKWSNVTSVRDTCWSSCLFSSYSDHRRVSHVTVLCLCWSSCLFIVQWSPRNDHTWLASKACADNPPPSISISRAAGPEIFLLEWEGYLYIPHNKKITVSEL